MSDKPNIVLIMTDQQRWDTLACLGFEHVITPNIDRLAGRGIAFTNAYVQGAVCGPSRNSIVSGMYVHSHGVEQNERWLRPDQPNWIESLRAGGYHTVNIGKMHTAPLRLPVGFDQRTVVENKNYEQGLHGPDPDDYDLYLAQFGLKRPAISYYRDIDSWPDLLGATVWPHAEELFPDNFVGRQTVTYLTDCDFDQPLFLWCGFGGPHDPFDVTASVLARYDDIEIPDPVCYPGELDDKPPPHREAMAAMEGRMSAAAIWWSRATPERIRRMRRHYYANITLIDDWVGSMAATLETRGQLDNTLFIFTSDHGDCLGDHHLVYKFSSHYDSVAKVPLVFAGPGVKGPGVRDQLVELIDLGPTLLDLVGLPPLDGAQGISMRSLIEGGSEELHDAVFSEQGQRVMVRTREWKMVAYLGESFGELYHLAEDPDELCNLYDVADCGGVRGDLAERLMHWYGSTRLRLPLYPG